MQYYHNLERKAVRKLSVMMNMPKRGCSREVFWTRDQHVEKLEAKKELQWFRKAEAF